MNGPECVRFRVSFDRALQACSDPAAAVAAATVIAAALINIRLSIVPPDDGHFYPKVRGPTMTSQVMVGQRRP
jgi:hypothetical protein